MADNQYPQRAAERSRQVKELHEKGPIRKENYDATVKEILDSQ